jgi:serine/threonine protein kinase
MISKLMLPDGAVDEMKVKPLLMGVDPARQYFLWPVETCDPEYEMPENSIPDTCNVAGHNASGDVINIRTKNPQVVLFENGGPDLAKIIDTGADTIEDCGQLLVGLYNLLEGLAALHAADAAHLDIKLPNLVAKKLGDGTFHIRFIDFGLTKHASELNPPNPNELSVYTNNYFAWPFELRYIYLKLAGGHLDDGLDTFYSDASVLQWRSPKVPVWMWYTAPIGRPLLKEAHGRAILVKAVGASNLQLIKAADVYSLGRVFAEMFSWITEQKCTGPDQFVDGSWAPPDNISIPFWRLIVRMMSPDMFERPSAAEAAAEYKKLVPLIQTLYNIGQPAPVASAPVATAPVASAPVASAPVASAHVASAPVASAPASHFQQSRASSSSAAAAHPAPAAYVQPSIFSPRGSPPSATSAAHQGTASRTSLFNPSSAAAAYLAGQQAASSSSGLSSSSRAAAAPGAKRINPYAVNNARTRRVLGRQPAQFISSGLPLHRPRVTLSNLRQATAAGIALRPIKAHPLPPLASSTAKQFLLNRMRKLPTPTGNNAANSDPGARGSSGASSGAASEIKALSGSR